MRNRIWNMKGLKRHIAQNAPHRHLLSTGMMSPPTPVTGVRLTDEETEAYAADGAVPNVQGVQGSAPTPDGSSKSVVDKRGKEEKQELLLSATHRLQAKGPNVPFWK